MIHTKFATELEKDDSLWSWRIASMYQTFGCIVSIATKDIEDNNALEGKEINEGER